MGRESIIHLAASIFVISDVVAIIAGVIATLLPHKPAPFAPDYLLNEARAIVEQCWPLPVYFDGRWCGCSARRCMCGGCRACDTCTCPKAREGGR